MCPRYMSKNGLGVGLLIPSFLKTVSRISFELSNLLSTFLRYLLNTLLNILKCRLLSICGSSLCSISICSVFIFIGIFRLINSDIRLFGVFSSIASIKSLSIKLFYGVLKFLIVSRIENDFDRPE